MANIKILILVTVLIICCTSSMTGNKGHKCKQAMPPPRTVPCVNLTKYLGLWYQQAEIPSYFSIGCTDVTAEYSFNDDGTIKVNNTCTRDGVRDRDGDVGMAMVEADVNSKLLVTFSGSFDTAGEYWIVRLAYDYTYAVVSNSDYSYLWILYREPNMPEELYECIVEDLRQDHFPVDMLVRTPFSVAEEGEDGEDDEDGEDG